MAERKRWVCLPKILFANLLETIAMAFVLFSVCVSGLPAEYRFLLHPLYGSTIIVEPFP